MPMSRRVSRASTTSRRIVHSRRSASSVSLSWIDVRRLSGSRPPETETGPLACFAPHREIPIQDPRETPADGQTQTRAVLRTGMTPLRLHERLEDHGQAIGGNAGAIV